MAFKGLIEAVCPQGCESFETEVWSFVRGDKDAELRETLIAQELNLLLCPQCGAAFFPEAPVVYLDSAAELLAFVFPPSYRERESYWREKMASDFAAMRKALGEGALADMEPRIFFSFEDLSLLLEQDDYLDEEREVMEFFARDLGLSLYRVSPACARERRVPRSLPYVPGPAGATLESVSAGLEKLLRANASLESYRAYSEMIGKGLEKKLPPAAARGR
ncbi:MAG TPA: CpXC domain-containing protein [Elusimicrobiota bacterium]|nr:CpXC domain-containing protein [Elusimicrobiota bacterium]